MKVGRFTIEQLNEGQFEFFEDGKINRTPVTENTEQHNFAGQKDALVGINPLYITDGNFRILVDTGLGWGLDTGSNNSEVSNVCTNLDIFDTAPEDITDVVLSHLHYDHAAGISRTDKNAITQPVFENAIHHVQKKEWNFAVQQVQQQSEHLKFYRLDDFYRLYVDNYFTLSEKEKEEIVPGITLIRTGGHTPGHQIVKITDSGETAYFMGDLLPTAKYLNNFHAGNFDVNMVEAKKMKINFLRGAYRENAVLFFYHSVHTTIGQLDRDEEKNYILKEI